MVFRDQGCYGCHTAEGMGTPIGPDLSRIGAKHNETYLTRWLRDPSMQRPSAHMPKLQLTETEVQALADQRAAVLRLRARRQQHHRDEQGRAGDHGATSSTS
jgi:cbb3-type cytochrome oxidase cytochrome c subunit